MSRTYRRKNFRFVSNWSREGCHRYGFDYTKEYVGGGEYVWREMTKEEKVREYLLIHGESKSANSRSPSKWFRLYRMVENRSINKRELVRWMKNPENYEPLFESDPRSCLWDWS